MKARYWWLALGFIVLMLDAYALMPTAPGHSPNIVALIGRFQLAVCAEWFGYDITSTGVANTFGILTALWAVWAAVVVLPAIVRHFASLLPSRQEWLAIVAHRFVPAGGWSLSKLVLTLSVTAMVIALIGAARNFYLGIFYGGNDASTFPWMVALIGAFVLIIIAVNLDWVAQRHNV